MKGESVYIVMKHFDEFTIEVVVTKMADAYNYIIAKSEDKESMSVIDIDNNFKLPTNHDSVNIKYICCFQDGKYWDHEYLFDKYYISDFIIVHKIIQ